jgi:hypothetical protein
MYAHDARGRASKQEGTSVGELTLMGGDEDAEAGAAEERDATDIEVHRAAAYLLVFFEQFGEFASVGRGPIRRPRVLAGSPQGTPPRQIAVGRPLTWWWCCCRCLCWHTRSVNSIGSFVALFGKARLQRAVGLIVSPSCRLVAGALARLLVTARPATRENTHMRESSVQA